MKIRVGNLVSLFLDHSVRQGCAESTIRHYRDRLRTFLDAFGDRKAKSIAREEILSHFHTSGAGLSDSTRRSNIVAVERVQKYALQFGHLKKPWIRPGDVQKPRQGQRSKFLTADQTERIVEALRPDARAIYRALRLTAARPGELCGAEIGDLEGSAGEAVLVIRKHKTARKTGRPRRIVLSAEAEQIVRAAIGDRLEGPVFTNRRGKAWTRERLSREFRGVRNALGITTEIVLYCTRHEAATQIVRAVGVAQAQGILGHTDIKTTQRYTHLNDDDLRAAAMALRDVVFGGAV